MFNILDLTMFLAENGAHLESLYDSRLTLCRVHRARPTFQSCSRTVRMLIYPILFSGVLLGRAQRKATMYRMSHPYIVVSLLIDAGLE